MTINDILSAYCPDDEEESASVAAIKRFIDIFGDDIYSRENIIGHFCASAWIVNPKHDKVLMAYHNIYQSYNWIGGHADGQRDILAVARREITEETGLAEFKILNNGMPIDINMEFVIPHFRRGKAVNAHLHLTFVYCFEADDTVPLTINPDENSEVCWLTNEEAIKSADKHMKRIYQRVLKKSLQTVTTDNY